jgi:hypothetical protein
MKHNKSIRFLLIALVVIVVTIATGLVSGALPSPGEWFSISPLAPPTPQARQGSQLSPLGTPVPLPRQTAIPISIATTMPTIPPPPGYPTGEPWPPQVTPEPQQPTPIRPPSLAPLGFPPADQQALYYVADNAGFSELHVIGMDTQGGKQSEFRATEDTTLGGINLVGLYPSPDGRYLALEFLGDGYGEVKIVERSSGRVWCPLEGPEGCWGSFEGWASSDQILFCPGNVPPEGVVPMGVIAVDLETGQYTPLDLPVQPEWGYSLAQNVSPSPDGSRLAYSIVEVEDGEEIVEIWTMRMDGNDRQRVYRAKGGVSYLSWSPVGEQLLYVYQSELGQFSPSELWLVNTDGSDARLLVANLAGGELGFRPAWSPDGRYVAFVQLDQPITFDGTYVILAWSNVCVVDTATGQIARLSSFERRQANFPTWSPDGRFVAFVSTGRLGEETLYSEVWVAGADGSQLYAVSGMAKPWNALAWLPPVSATEAR